jgi:cytochrome c-type biogenesis protein CcmH/NrfG
MNTTIATLKDSSRELDGGAAATTNEGGHWRIALSLLFALRNAIGGGRPSSVLRNNTNLPMFFALALALSLACNFALRESSAHASRFSSPTAGVEDLQELLARNPDDPALHSRLGELHMQQRNYRRAMFHFRESSRLNDLYGE